MKTVLITGSSRGIGAEMARVFAQNNYNVVINYHESEKEAMQLLKQLRQTTTAIAVKCDVSDYAQMQKMRDLSFKAFGKVDVLINNAAIALNRLITQTQESEWDRLFSVNVKGAFNAINAFVPSMIERKCGTVINISSVWGIQGAACEAAYSATKAALIGFSKALAKELGPSGITVNSIAPGVIDTDMNKNLTEKDLTALKERTALCRLGSALDVAQAALFLANSSFVTGQILGVDGGFSL